MLLSLIFKPMVQSSNVHTKVTSVLFNEICINEEMQRIYIYDSFAKRDHLYTLVKQSYLLNFVSCSHNSNYSLTNQITKTRFSMKQPINVDITLNKNNRQTNQIDENHVVSEIQSSERYPLKEFNGKTSFRTRRWGMILFYRISRV